MRIRGATWMAALLLALAWGGARADQLIMVRVARAFPETMNSLQLAIRDQGYQVSRVQRVDVGLTASGFETAEYRLVFFGKSAEIRELATSHPQLIPYLPLQIVIFAEGDDTLVLTASPRQLAALYPDPALRARFDRWEQDVRAVLDRLSTGP